MARTLIRARWVVGSDGATHDLIEHGEVVYEDDSILFVGHHFDGTVDHTINAGNAVVGPGFVDLDALFDLDSTVLGFDNHPGWQKGRVWAEDYIQAGPRDVYTEEEEAFQHEYAMAQLLLNGITTALPIRSILYRAWAETYAEHAEAVEIAGRLGIRMYLGPSYRTGLPVVKQDTSIGMHWDEDRGMQGLAEAIRFVQDFDGAHDGLITGFLQPDRIEGCTEKLLVATRDAAEELDCLIRLHCCQSELEVQIVHKRWEKSSLAVLRDLGLLSARSLLPHGWLLGGIAATPATIDAELDWLADSGATIVHCPLVSARHGQVLKSFGRYRDRGVKIGLGTDTFPPDMIQNMHIGVMSARIADESMHISAADMYTSATIGGADALGRPDLGRLSTGAKADIVIVDLGNSSMGQVFDPIQAMVLNGSGRDVKTVIVNGREVVRNREIPGLDMAALHSRSQDLFQKLIASYPERAYGHPPVTQLFPPSFPVRDARAAHD